MTIDSNTNRITGSPYSRDLNGNMTNDGLNSLVYDAESRAVSSTTNGTTSTYTYDGNGLRVKKQVGSATAAVYVFSGTKVIAEYASGAAVGSPTKEYIYSGSTLLATIAGSTTSYHHADHLSVRLTTDTSGNSLGQQGSYPYGEQWYPAPPQAPATKWQFTSYERDGAANESGNDYAKARSYVNRLGRFSSPDPVGGPITDPQSLNRYAYVRNDPANLVDPLGLFVHVDATPHGFSLPADGGGVNGGLAVSHIAYLDPIGGLGGFDITKLTGKIPGPPPPPGYQQCIEEALLQVVAHGEGMDNEPNAGYGTVVRGRVTDAPQQFANLIGTRNAHVDDPAQLSGHPNILVNWGRGHSTAFGRYQINAPTAAEFGLTDFSPLGQDAGAIAIMQSSSMVVPAMNGNFQQAMWNGNRRWASLPGSPYGQPTMTMGQAYAVFQNALNTLPDCQ